MKDFKYYFIAIGAVVLVLFLRGCANDSFQQSKGENSVLEKQVKKEKDGLQLEKERRLREKDSINKKIAEKDKEVKQLKDKLSQSDFKIAELELKLGKDKLKIKNMSLVKVADTLNSIYGGKNATANSSDISVKGNLPYQLVETAVENSFSKNVIKEKDKQLVVFDSIVSAKDKIISNKDILIVSAEKNIDKAEQLQKAQEDLNKGLEKENKKLKKRNFLDKVLIPIAGAAGVFAGLQLAR